MTKKILIDASHAEETRVVVLDGNRLEDFDVETATRRQIKGNIYLAKVIRVEPSLQAAFVEYGGNRHGFLAFGEIHPDYYQIPLADRQRLLAMQAEDDEDELEPEYEAEAAAPVAAQAPLMEGLEAVEPNAEVEPVAGTAQALEIKPIAIIAAAPPEFDEPPFEAASHEHPSHTEPTHAEAVHAEPTHTELTHDTQTPDAPAQDEPAAGEPTISAPIEPQVSHAEINNDDALETEADEMGAQATEPSEPANAEPVMDLGTVETFEEALDAPPPESLGGDGDDAAEARERRQRQRFLRNYKIQDVIHRRQIMLIQVVKEERGNKGAALTTYLSLAGRFSVLMPNSPSGGGVSRKITSVADRRRLKEAMAELDVPQGMGLIVRTAGANRPKPEIKRDCEYLLRLWDDIRERTFESTAPALIYEEASLIKRTIRDVYTRDVDDVIVDGEEGYRAAHDFMRMLMPANAKKVQLWTEGQPLFSKYQVEAQLDAMLNPTVQLRSGGYIVINQTEALVAIDVNSGRSTRERSIEDTALRTNLEAAEEVARQVRMRDLAGLIVIDFIDMESRKNNAAVERKMKDALKNDRARIQVGAISHFGLMEMSRQRLRPSLAEASLITCPHCAGMGHVRSSESAALHILRAIEDEGAKFRAAEIMVVLPAEIGLYLFNHKRDRLSAIEARYAMRVLFSTDASLTGSNFRIEKLKAQTAPLPAPAAYHATPAITDRTPQPDVLDVEDDAEGDDEDETPNASSAPETAEEGERKRRRRRRRGKRRYEPGSEAGPAQPDPRGEAEADSAEPTEDEPTEIDLVIAAELGEDQAAAEGSEEPARRRRSRGGRRRRQTIEGVEPAEDDTAPLAEPVFADIADIFEAAERAEEEAARVRAEARMAPQPDLVMSEVQAAPAAAMAAEAQEAEPAPVTPPAAPVVQPIIITPDAPVAEKKRGWWRR
ncbi:MAG: ribonuclease E/G [Acidocella sp. 20-57-95]|nr:MAG: ribonuclease E/G [Acidocella sp. 20-57-95]OYV62494.1 MAG: ribonuclease E/G [Acidocella sp. 21-58-7]HQT64077.1 Rne/Rng family ribonuclease [Acidocella sp.]HQU03345.1 Rne/Rng family ribonuclease [Acidocella sp.]